MEDLSKLLKDAPRGMKLYSPLFGEVTFGYVSAGNTIWVTSSNGKTMLMFTRNGKYCLNFHSEDDIDESAECLLFPSKDCRTWEGWKPPVESNFKVGDWIVRGRGFVYEPSLITEIRDYYICELINGERVTYTLNDGHKNFHLWTIADAKEGDVLVVNGSSKEYKWIGIFKALTSDTSFSSHCHYNCGMCEFVTHIARCTKHGTKYNDIRPATNEERDILFAEMREAGYEWDAEKKELKKIQPHYNISNFKVGMPVLIRNYNNNQWEFTFFGRYQKDKEYPFRCADSYTHIQCIPFEGNEKLLGTTDMCPEEYVNW